MKIQFICQTIGHKGVFAEHEAIKCEAPRLWPLVEGTTRFIEKYKLYKVVWRWLLNDSAFDLIREFISAVACNKISDEKSTFRVETYLIRWGSIMTCRHIKADIWWHWCIGCFRLRSLLASWFPYLEQPPDAHCQCQGYGLQTVDETTHYCTENVLQGLPNFAVDAHVCATGFEDEGSVVTMMTSNHGAVVAFKTI